MSKIFFNPSSEEHSIVVPPPKPASLYKSEWWKESPAFYDTQDLYKTYAEKILNTPVKVKMYIKNQQTPFPTFIIKEADLLS